MIPDIAACQAAGKKVLLSLAGGYPQDQWLHSDASATSFAQFLVGAFGAPTASWTAVNGPRPIGDSHVDGFDFDIETNFPVDPVFEGQSYSDAESRGYATMANTLHGLGYLTSAAPQCVRPDAHLGPALSSAWFDYVFVQFYNTAGCSAMDFIQGTPNSFNFDAWASATYANENTKVYIGLVSWIPKSYLPKNSLELSNFVLFEHKLLKIAYPKYLAISEELVRALSIRASPRSYTSIHPCALHPIVRSIMLIPATARFDCFCQCWILPYTRSSTHIVELFHWHTTFRWCHALGSDCFCSQLDLWQ